MPKANKIGLTQAYASRVSTNINLRTQELIFLLCASSGSRKSDK